MLLVQPKTDKIATFFLKSEIMLLLSSFNDILLFIFIKNLGADQISHFYKTFNWDSN